MDLNEKIFYVIGYIDSYGAIHHKALRLDDPQEHSHYWPTQTHKTWRFVLSQWQLSNSILSKENLTEAEAEDVIAFVRKHYSPPLWVIEGEEWEALGRPRKGKAYEKHLRKWDRMRRLHNA
jgi:hypothetical protein